MLIHGSNEGRCPGDHHGGGGGLRSQRAEGDKSVEVVGLQHELADVGHQLAAGVLLNDDAQP
jgi:hypothetical protein